MPPDLTDSYTDDEVIETASTILDSQTDDGLILWFPGGHSDPWNHVEAAMALDICGFSEAALRAYDWLRVNQADDGWWHNYYFADRVKDAKIDTNVCAYIAAGVWHHYLLTGDRSFLADYKPVVERAIDFVLGMQKPTGEVIWARHVDGTPWSFALLTGSSSIYHSLECAIEIVRELGDERPDWVVSLHSLGAVISDHPERFEPKDRWAMDWYYPVLAGPLLGDAARAHLAAQRDTFIMDGLGVRCVSDRPWVTAAETAECAMAYVRAGLMSEAAELLAWTRRHRQPDGTVLTGLVYPEEIAFPAAEHTTYTSGAIVLAHDALTGTGPASKLFGSVAVDGA